MPPRTDEATEPAAAITATPSIRQARKMRNPFSPPRSSRRANRIARGQFADAGPRLSIACRGAPMWAPDRRAATRGRPYGLFICDLAVDEVDGAGAAGGDHGVVGDEEQRGAAYVAQREHQVDDVAAGLAVEIAGGFVGQQQARRDDEGARQRHALLLAARKLARVM